MLRLGGTGFGVGLAAGYAPDRANGGFATDVHKSSAFVDWSLANGRASYQGAVALHDESGGTSLAQRYLSVSQRVRLGRAFLLQRVRFDAAGGRGGWSLANLDLNALTPLAGDLLVRAHYGRRSFTWTGLGEPDTVRPHQERLGGGLLFAGAHISLGADLSLTQWDDGTRAATWSASLAVPRTPVAGIGFGATATRYGAEDGDSYFLAPYLTRLFGTVSTNLSYQRYRTGGGRADDYQAGLLALSFPLPGRMYASLRAQSQWGSAASGNRLFASLARSF
jgi:hypothetical protein